MSHDFSGSRGSFLDIAERVLSESGKPMSAREIVTVAIHRGWLSSEGLTPWQTMKSKLAVDILSQGEKSRFKRTHQALFTLRRLNYEEFFATRFQKNKLDEQIAVIDLSALRQLMSNAGLRRGGIDRRLLSELARPMQRRQAEDNFSVIQLVSVFVVHCQGRYLTHMRSARLPEQRLHGEYSIMLGGHLAIEDFSQLTLDLFPEDSLDDCSYILRELSEELVLNTPPRVSAVGVLYDDSRDVSRQHLGLVYWVDLSQPDYEIGERGFLMHSKFETLGEIARRIEQFENWSVILFKELQADRDRAYAT